MSWRTYSKIIAVQKYIWREDNINESVHVCRVIFWCQIRDVCMIVKSLQKWCGAMLFWKLSFFTLTFFQSILWVLLYFAGPFCWRMAKYFIWPFGKFVHQVGWMLLFAFHGSWSLCGETNLIINACTFLELNYTSYYFRISADIECWCYFPKLKP